MRRACCSWRCGWNFKRSSQFTVRSSSFVVVSLELSVFSGLAIGDEIGNQQSPGEMPGLLFLPAFVKLWKAQSSHIVILNEGRSGLDRPESKDLRLLVASVRVGGDPTAIQNWQHLLAASLEECFDDCALVQLTLS